VNHCNCCKTDTESFYTLEYKEKCRACTYLKDFKNSGSIEEISRDAHQWISVDKALPESWGNVLIYTKCQSICMGYYNHDDECWKYIDSLGEVIYWQSLPTIPKEY